MCTARSRTDPLVLMWKMKDSSGNVLGIKRKISTPGDQVIGAMQHIMLTDIPQNEKLDKRWDIYDAKNNVMGCVQSSLSASCF